MRRFLIKTKYLGARNSYGARIRVSLRGYKPVTVGYNHACDFKDNCREAAKKFIVQNGVNWVLDSAPIDDGSSCIFWVAVES